MTRRYEIFSTATVKRGGCVEVEAGSPEEAKAFAMDFLKDCDESNVTRSWPDCVVVDDPEFELGEPAVSKVMDTLLAGGE